MVNDFREILVCWWLGCSCCVPRPLALMRWCNCSRTTLDLWTWSNRSQLAYVLAVRGGTSLVDLSVLLFDLRWRYWIVYVHPFLWEFFVKSTSVILSSFWFSFRTSLGVCLRTCCRWLAIRTLENQASSILFSDEKLHPLPQPQVGIADWLGVFFFLFIDGTNKEEMYLAITFSPDRIIPCGCGALCVGLFI